MTEEEMEEAAERAMNAASHLLSSNPSSHAKTWASGLIVVPHDKICGMILPKITHKLKELGLEILMSNKHYVQASTGYINSNFYLMACSLSSNTARGRTLTAMYVPLKDSSFSNQQLTDWERWRDYMYMKNKIFFY